MRTAAIFFSFVATLLACKSSTVPPPDAETTSSDTPPPWVDDTPSIYESIKPPVLAIDTSAIYFELNEALQFTNRLERDGTTSIYGAVYNIDKTREIKILRRDDTSLGKEMMKIDDIILNSMKVVDPACLVKDNSIAVDYTIEMHLYIDDDRISIRVCGAESKCFLKHNFKRPL
jgi:hypothetical protein